MIDVNGLKAYIVKNGLTQKDVASKLGISPKTFYTKMQTGKFGLDEATEMTKILSIENPSAIFFASQVT